jgi:hypothetical protein
MRTGKRRQVGAIVLIISISSLTFLNAWVRLQPLDQPRPDVAREELEEEAGLPAPCFDYQLSNIVSALLRYFNALTYE